MKAYHGQIELKNIMVEEAIKHREADQLRQGFGYGRIDDGVWRGCAVGCTLHTVNIRFGKGIDVSKHGAYETELGVPRILARLEDGIFESLPSAQALTWPQRFLEAIPVGVDLSGVADKFMHWLLVDPTDGVIKFAKTDRTRKAIQDVADLFAKKVAGENVTQAQWDKARSAAYAYAYAAAAYAAAYAAAAYAAAAAAAAYAYAYAAADAADAAYAAADARTAARVRQSEKLIELMAAATIAE